MAGVSFVVAKNQSIKELKKIEPRGYYLSLFEQYEYFSKSNQMRFTPPVQTIYALKQAITELKEESIKKDIFVILIHGIY